jgi:hypothetical protein
MEWLTEQGAHVFIPVGHSPDIDLLAEIDGQTLRIEVKTTTHRRSGRWGASVATRGGNQSWSGVVKHFDANRCDFLFVLVGDGRRWFIPAGAIEATVRLSLGGAKYSEFEVSRGRPIPGSDREGVLESSPASGECPSGQRILAVNQAAYAYAGSNPASPISCSEDDAIMPTAYERKLGQQGQAVINQKRRITIPQKAFFGAGLANGARVSVRAEGPGRIVIEQIELPDWARPSKNGDVGQIA